MLPPSNNSFFAIESFDTVPVDMFRNVYNSSASPYVMTDPEVELLGSSRQWTKVTPIQCGSLRDHEAKFPTVGITQENRAFVSGISLDFQCTEADSPPGSDPFAPIGEVEMAGETRMSAEDYQQTVGEGHSILGILQTKASHGDDWQRFAPSFKGWVEPKKVEYKGRGNKDEWSKKKIASKREIIFRYKLPAGTSLKGYGVKVVCDNKTTGHCTMVCEREVPNSYDWNVFGNVILPSDWDRKLLPSNDGFNTDDFDKWLQAAYKPLEGEEPVFMRLPRSKQVWLLKVASKFSFAYVQLKASAEPLSPRDTNDDDDDHRRKLYHSNLVLYHVGGDSDIYQSIERLADTNYSLETLDVESRLVLLHAMQALNSECDDDYDIAELMGDSTSTTSYLPNGLEPIKCLLDGIHVLEEYGNV